MSENNDYIQLPPLKKDTPSDVVAFMWEYMKVPEDSREKVKNLLKDANENGVKISHQAPTLYDVVPKEEIAEFEELMRKTIADIVSEASSVACWVYVQKYVKHKTLNEMLQELPDVGQFIIAILILIVLGCLCAELIMTKDPTYMDLLNYNKAPDREFLFGTDTMGRDIFSMIWYGGRISILIGGLATVISTFIAVVVGAFSGVAPGWLDELIMRFTEIFLSIPTLLLIILLQAIMGEANILSLSFVIGVTSWTSIAKVVRTEVRQIRNSEYIIAARCMGAGFFRILWKHLVPNFFSSIMFMVVMNVRTAMISEATLSFMGIGLPIEVITWGSMLSLSDKALMTGSWWIILIPGLFLITTVLCLTNIGNACREQTNRKESNF